MKPAEMGTTGLVAWVWAAPTARHRGQRKRRALAIIEQRRGPAAPRYFREALAAATFANPLKEWARI